MPRRFVREESVGAVVPPVTAVSMAAPTATDLQLAASLGDAAAQVRLGYMYLTGQGVAKDEARAVKLYEAAANQGDTHAQVYLGDMYERGVVAQDKARAAQLYQDAADQGRADAQVLLAHMYKHGRGVIKDDALAVRLFQAAADQGHAPRAGAPRRQQLLVDCLLYTSPSPRD